MNSNNLGFFISELQVIGTNKNIATLSFSKGTNIISGASNTGKSFVFDCIDFAMGASDSPKEDIPEGKGYDTVILEIGTYSNQFFTICRKFNSKKVSIKNGKISESGIETELNADASGLNNLSDFLLELCGFNDNKFLKENASNKKRRVSFRDIRGLSFISELKIIKKASPIFYSDQNIDKTVQTSLFKFLLSSIDDSDLVKVEEVKLFKSRLNGKIELLRQLLEEDVKVLEEYGNLSVQTALQILEDKLLILFENLNKQNEAIEKLVNDRKELNDKKIETQSKVDFQIELIKRFNLLIVHYETDLKRLEFIADGNYFMSQLNTVSCPVCGGELDKDHIFCLDEKTQDDQFRLSLKAEINKISLKLEDLKNTIFESEKFLSDFNLVLNQLESQINKIDVKIKTEIQPITIKLKEEITLSLEEKAKFSEYNLIDNRINKYASQINELEIAIKHKPKGETIDIDQLPNYYEKFCEKVRDILLAIGYPKSNIVTFDGKSQDICINLVERKSSGKGFRAITFSSFILGLMTYCFENSLPHPKCIILDSPLTTYKKNDKPPQNDIIGTDMESNFFTFLSNLSDDMQVIIFENKEPNENLKSKFNYVHFAGDEGTGRKGFFPID
jgi:hypothetical protein